MTAFYERERCNARKKMTPKEYIRKSAPIVIIGESIFLTLFAYEGFTTGHWRHFTHTLAYTVITIGIMALHWFEDDNEGGDTP